MKLISRKAKSRLFVAIAAFLVVMNECDGQAKLDSHNKISNINYYDLETSFVNNCCDKCKEGEACKLDKNGCQCWKAVSESKYLLPKPVQSVSTHPNTQISTENFHAIDDCCNNCKEGEACKLDKNGCQCWKAVSESKYLLPKPIHSVSTHPNAQISTENFHAIDDCCNNCKEDEACKLDKNGCQCWKLVSAYNTATTSNNKDVLLSACSTSSFKCSYKPFYAHEDKCKDECPRDEKFKCMKACSKICNSDKLSCKVCLIKMGCQKCWECHMHAYNNMCRVVKSLEVDRHGCPKYPCGKRECPEYARCPHNCVRYDDGCNQCQCDPKTGSFLSCTKKQCNRHRAPKCLSTLKQINEVPRDIVSFQPVLTWKAINDGIVDNIDILSNHTKKKMDDHWHASSKHPINIATFSELETFLRTKIEAVAKQCSPNFMEDCIKEHLSRFIDNVMQTSTLKGIFRTGGEKVQQLVAFFTQRVQAYIADGSSNCLKNYHAEERERLVKTIILDLFQNCIETGTAVTQCRTYTLGKVREHCGMTELDFLRYGPSSGSFEMIVENRLQSGLCDSVTSCKELLAAYLPMLGENPGLAYSKIIAKALLKFKAHLANACTRAKKMTRERCLETTANEGSKNNIADTEKTTIMKNLVNAAAEEASDRGRQVAINCMRNGQPRQTCFKKVKDMIEKEDESTYRPEFVRKMATGQAAQKIYHTCLETSQSTTGCPPSGTEILLRAKCLRVALNTSVESHMLRTVTEAYNAFTAVGRLSNFRGEDEFQIYKDCQNSHAPSARQEQEVQRQGYANRISLCNDNDNKITFRQCLAEAENELVLDEGSQQIQFVRQQTISDFALDRSLDICDSSDNVHVCLQEQERLCREYMDDQDPHSGECWLSLKRAKLIRVLERCKAFEESTTTCSELIRAEIPELTDDPETDLDFVDIHNNMDKALRCRHTNRISVKLDLSFCNESAWNVDVHSDYLRSRMGIVESPFNITCSFGQYSKEQCFISCDIVFLSDDTQLNVKKILANLKTELSLELVKIRNNIRRVNRRNLGEKSSYLDFVAAQGITDYADTDAITDGETINTTSNYSPFPANVALDSAAIIIGCGTMRIALSIIVMSAILSIL